MRLSLDVFPIVTTVLTHKMWLNVAIEPEFGRCGCSTEAEAFTATVQRLQCSACCAAHAAHVARERRCGVCLLQIKTCVCGVVACRKARCLRKLEDARFVTNG